MRVAICPRTADSFIFFPSLRTEEQPDAVSVGFFVGFGLFQIQTSLHILPYHSYMFWKDRYTWTHGCEDHEQLD